MITLPTAESLALESIVEINWAAGEPDCIILYAPASTPSSQKLKVSLVEMERVCPTFERMLHVAAVLTKDEPRGARPSLVAELLRRWSTLVKPVFDARDLIIMGGDKVCFWSAATTFKTSREQGGTVDDYAGFIDWRDGTFSHYHSSILEANCPGFNTMFDVLCFEHSMDHTQAFRLLGKLACALPFSAMSKHAGDFPELLRLYAPLQMTDADVVSLVQQHVADAECRFNGAGVALPDLSHGVCRQ